MEAIVKIISAEYITHDVKRFQVEKPDGFVFSPGQATELSINKEGWGDKKNPFTFTSLPDAPYLEFVIKIYEERKAVTQQFGLLKAGDEIVLREAWGAIEYKGPGYFIAGGAGITPFLAILRHLKAAGRIADNALFFSNKTDRDIILADELKAMLGNNAQFTVTRQKDSAYDHRRIDESYLKSEVKDFGKHFYVCGPDAMVSEITETLEKLGVKTDSLVFEK